MKSKTGFSKKDLIVLLACIVFVLTNIAAIGTSGRRRAKEMVCLSNLHQWAGVFQAFINDNHGYLMQGWYVSGQAWQDILRPYYGGGKGGIKCCPEATEPGMGMSDGTFGAWTFPGSDYGSYGTSSCIYNPPQPGLDYWRRSDVAGADNVPLFLDAQWVTAYPWWTNTPPEYEGAPWYPGGGMGIFCIPRHYGAINGLFLDFSARKIGLKELWLLKWARTYDLTEARENEPDWTIGTGWMVPLKDYDYIRP